jgi:hypothetical protein
MRSARRGRTRALAIPLLTALGSVGCDAPHTLVVLDNGYPAASRRVVYHAMWQAVSFPAAVPPGASSVPQPTVAASPNTAYALLAPGWDPAGRAPTTFLVLRSQKDYGVRLGDTLHIPVDDTSFVGDCAAGSPLSQAEADFITGRVFSGDLGGYDAATCTSTLGAGGP